MKSLRGTPRGAYAHFARLGDTAARDISTPF
jgi:hypothetical protein